MVDLFLDDLVPYWNGLVEARSLPKEVAVVGLVSRELCVVCGAILEVLSRKINMRHGHSSMPTTPKKSSSSSICSYMPWSLSITILGVSRSAPVRQKGTHVSWSYSYSTRVGR